MGRPIRSGVRAYSILRQLAGFGEALVSITPLIFTGLSVAFCNRTGLFNIEQRVSLLSARWELSPAICSPAASLIHVPLAWQQVLAEPCGLESLGC